MVISNVDFGAWNLNRIVAVPNPWSETKEPEWRGRGSLDLEIIRTLLSQQSQHSASKTIVGSSRRPWQSVGMFKNQHARESKFWRRIRSQ